jgi:hypothetical protein
MDKIKKVFNVEAGDAGLTAPHGAFDMGQHKNTAAGKCHCGKCKHLHLCEGMMHKLGNKKHKNCLCHGCSHKTCVHSAWNIKNKGEIDPYKLI